MFTTRLRTVKATAATRAMARQARWEQSPADAAEFDPDRRTTFGDYSRMASRPADSTPARRAVESIGEAIRRDVRMDWQARGLI